jgi:hypothetical protein
MIDEFDVYRNQLRDLINTKRHIVCYIQKDTRLMSAIESYCKNLPIIQSTDLNEKAYWMLHGLTDYPICQYELCSNRVSFRGLKIGYSTACCNSHAQIVARPKINETNLIRYGSTTPLQNKEIREKINQHNIETYGTTHIVNSAHFAKKRIETC